MNPSTAVLIGEQPEELSSYSMAPEVGLLLNKAEDNLQSFIFAYVCNPLMYVETRELISISSAL